MSRRWVKVLAIAVVVVAVLFTLVDRVAVHYADKEVAQLAKEKYGYGNTTDGHLDLAIKGFPFLTQVAGGTLHHVTLDAGRFYVSNTTNARGGYLHIERLHLDLNDVTVTSLSGRRAEANLATGTLTLSYKELSGAVTRLAGDGGPLTVSQASGSSGQAARVRISGTVGGKAVNGIGTLLAQGDELTLNLPGVERANMVWTVGLPSGAGFTAARADEDGVEMSIVGHQVNLGSSRY
ncbi:LmeA family phospholipid-binding protein [Streptomyces sp. NBC_00385]|uniref:LmeA family phospholipid-binding protein n=1 Tax=Streptomyces sp. NBC_00385 TaxID=2975733 RepID=UPI002DD96929|nr:DUF2993 domain-containing protein [Streptomyces sp. NBC_00385]WRZ03146.1 DUF2993 domain-containing protein [Streptomyces sp. NBC_00385]